VAKEFDSPAMPGVKPMPLPPDSRIIPLDRQTALTHQQVEQVRFGLGDTGPLAQAVLNANVPALAKQLATGAVSCLSTRRPADPVVGQMIFETDTNLSKFWDGSAWVNAGSPPVGAAGGMLSGTYPNPSVASISGLAAAGDLTGTYPNPTITNITNAPIHNSNTTLSFRTSSTERMSVDAGGRLSLPYQPAASGWMNNGVGALANAFYVANNLVINRGSHYNTGNGRFTCPVAGAYAMFYQTIAWASPGYGYVDVYKNGVGTGMFAHYNLTNLPGGSNWANLNVNAVINCAANDYLQFYIRAVGGNNGVYPSSHNGFSIFYLG
jgi:hypothetical protein